MNTLFDFLTHVKGVEYIASLTFIAVYLIYTEFLKPKPFSTMVKAAEEDIEYMKRAGYKQVLKSIGRIVTAPVVGLAYIAILPFAFFMALVSTVINKVLAPAGRELSFGWRPLEAYFSGEKHDEKKEVETK